jgi:phenylacetate-CoA ligase
MKIFNQLRELCRYLRGACFSAYYWGTGRRSLLHLVDQVDKLYMGQRVDIDNQVKSRLNRLLTYAAINVPYYRNLINHKELSEATALSDINKFPILTKSIIRNQGKHLISEQLHGKTQWNTSGGSTGEPVRLLQDINMMQKGRAIELLYMRWAGHKMGEPHVLIWGVPEDTFNENISLHERIFRIIHNETYLNCYKITDEMLSKWIQFINKKRPTLIETYVDAIYELSRLIIKKKLPINSPRAIITSAGVLMPHMKEVITKAFDCPVINRYGSREVGAIACSCMTSNELHVNEYACYVEIVDDDGNSREDGKEGDILVTLLTNYAMPLIRYKIQDKGVWALGSCTCGRNTKRLANVSGRQSDYLLASDGSKINGTALTTLLYPVSHIIKRYQYRQVKKNKVVLHVVSIDGFDIESLKREMQPLLEKLQSMLLGMSVELNIVDEIIPSKSGKYRYIIREEPVNK